MTASVGFITLSTTSRAAVVAPKPIRALLISGGCCHDYPGQDLILSEGISKRAKVDWTIVRDPSTGTKGRPSIYSKPDWSSGFDVVVHNECFADEKELAWLDRILEGHRKGVPAVVIHCSMHCYRAPTNEWFKFVGVTSHRHGPHFAYALKNVRPEHPVMKGFPAEWQTPKEELYNIAKLWPDTIPLGTGYSPETKKDETCIWVSNYEGVRVFGTTVGHYNHTMKEPVFMDLLARGLLWACAKLDDEGQPKPGYAPAVAPAP
ncbi:MAG: ThuA domain-containing protein [Verrucomicrobia bacterium]|nr:ThuA domain-containing protein [Verrucomicrobiota bacterium]